LTISAVKIGTLIRNSPNSAPSIGHVAIRVKGVPSAVRWSFLLFVFSFPFEAIDISFIIGSATIVKLAGFLFFALYCLYYGPFFGERSFFPPISISLYWFLGYLIVYVLNFGFTDERLLGEYPFWEHCFTLIQFLVLFWLASSLLTEQKMARSVLLAYSIASGLVALGVLVKVPGFYEQIAQGRVTAFGDNANAVAGHMAFAAVITTGLCVYGSQKHLLSRFVLVGLTLALLVVMVKTGSRGTSAAFLFGAWVYLLPYGRSKRIRTGIGLALLSIIAVVYLSASNPHVFERWRESYEGDLAQRQVIFPTAIDMILERPIFGWHPTIWDYELGRRIGLLNGIDAHNLVFSILLEVGIVGASPFFVGLWSCGRSAWRARRGSLGALPLALMVTALGVSMTGTGLILSSSKAQWLILALTIAAGAIAPLIIKPGEHCVSQPVKRIRRPF